MRNKFIYCFSLKKMFIMMLSAIIVAFTITSSAFASESNDTIKKITDENGIVWTLKMEGNSDSKTITLTSENHSDDKYSIDVDNSSQAVTLTTYKYKEESIFSHYAIESEKTFNLKDIINNEDSNDTFAQMSWYTKIYETYKNKYWYQYGSSSYGNTYLRIGCTASYAIPFYALSSGKQSNCKQYTSDIKDVRKYVSKLAAARDTSWAIGVVGIALGFTTAGISVVVATLVAAIGCSTTEAYYAADAAEAYTNVQEDYLIIRNYA